MLKKVNDKEKSFITLILGQEILPKDLLGRLHLGVSLIKPFTSVIYVGS
jgi:hypothetical protein